MKPIEFFFDATKPKNLIAGIKEGGIYFDTLNIVIKPDNSKDVVDNINVNGKDLKESEYTKNADGSIALKLTEFKEYTLDVKTLDAAGNISDTHQIKFEITNNVFVKIYETKPIFYGIIIGAGLALLALSIFLILFKKKKIVGTTQASQ